MDTNQSRRVFLSSGRPRDAKHTPRMLQKRGWNKSTTKESFYYAKNKYSSKIPSVKTKHIQTESIRQLHASFLHQVAFNKSALIRQLLNCVLFTSFSCSRTEKDHFIFRFLSEESVLIDLVVMKRASSILCLHTET